MVGISSFCGRIKGLMKKFNDNTDMKGQRAHILTVCEHSATSSSGVLPVTFISSSSAVFRTAQGNTEQRTSNLLLCKQFYFSLRNTRKTLADVRRQTLVEQHFTFPHRAAKGSCHLNTRISAPISVTRLHTDNVKRQETSAFGSQTSNGSVKKIEI